MANQGNVAGGVQGMSGPAGLEIFTNPKDLAIKISDRGGGTFEIDISRGLRGDNKPIVRSRSTGDRGGAIKKTQELLERALAIGIANSTVSETVLVAHKEVLSEGRIEEILKRLSVDDDDRTGQSDPGVHVPKAMLAPISDMSPVTPESAMA